jgi:hypothetical protein
LSKKLRILALSLLTAFLLSSCTRAKDALVSNPCSAAAEVKLSSLSSAPTRDEDWDFVVNVPPEDQLRVEGSLLEEATVYFVQVRFPNLSAELLTVPQTELDPEPILIPQRLCSSS